VEESENRMAVNKKSKIICQFYDTIVDSEMQRKGVYFNIEDLYELYQKSV
jgi:hypothetical protein